MRAYADDHVPQEHQASHAPHHVRKLFHLPLRLVDWSQNLRSAHSSEVPEFEYGLSTQCPCKKPQKQQVFKICLHSVQKAYSRDMDKLAGKPLVSKR